MIWKNSKMTVLYYSDEHALNDHPCIVRMDSNEILVEYEDERFIQYLGKNTGDGHFELHAPDVDGRATLHMFSQSTILEGYWIEGSHQGMWRIKLA